LLHKGDEGASRIWVKIRSQTNLGMNPRMKMEKKVEDVDWWFCGTRGNHTTWRRFQGKWGRSATL